MSGQIARRLSKRVPFWVWRLFVYAVFGGAILLGAAVLALRLWLLPTIDQHRAVLAHALGEAIGHPVAVGRVEGEWEGLRPRLALRDVRIHGADGRPAIVLGSVSLVPSWLSLASLEPRFDWIGIESPVLAVERAPDGRIGIAGLALSAESTAAGPGLAGWLLRQGEIVVRDARVTWVDRLRAAPALTFDRVSVRLASDLGRHRFGIRAVPPSHLASALDVRGDLVAGRSLHGGAVNGQVYVDLQYVDIAAWRPWVDFPVAIRQGVGALRMWTDLVDGEPQGVLADVRLTAVRTRLGADLPEMSLASLAGRVGWRDWRQGVELTLRGVELRTAVGQVVRPADFSFRQIHAQGARGARGEMRAGDVALAPLATLAEHLPLGEGLRELLARIAPTGTIDDLSARWTGTWPPSAYQASARFRGLSIKPHGRLPGFANVSGTMDASESRGTLRLADRKVRLDLPRVFAEPLELDTLDAEVNWASSGDDHEIRLTRVSFDNPDLAGSVQGRYRTVPGTPGEIELEGRLTRADARRVARYLPLVVPQNTRRWVRAAVVAGQARDVRLRLRGKLHEFPFGRGEDGELSVVAQTYGVVLDYADGWPRIEDLSAELAFVANRMEVRARGARMSGVRLGPVRAVIPDLMYSDEVLEIKGEATGPTAEFLRFIATSPVQRMIDGFTQDMRAEGDGRLTLALTLPLRTDDPVRIAGSYAFAGNALDVDSEAPRVEEAEGTIVFTERSVTVARVHGRALGGTVAITGGSGAEGIDLRLEGRASIAGLRAAGPAWLLGHLSGEADWRGLVRIRGRQADLSVESDLVGVASTLPHPFSKDAQGALNVRLERRIEQPGSDTVRASLGDVASAHLARSRIGNVMRIERGTIAFGGARPAQQRDGLWVGGRLQQLDLDRWRAVLGGDGGMGAEAAALSGMQLRVEALEVLGRTFHQVDLDARLRDGRWQGVLHGREVDGTFSWAGEGSGNLVARLARFTLPPAGARIAPGQGEPPSDPAYPAIDLTVDEFRLEERALGRLALEAVPEVRDWRIVRLELSNPDGTLEANGVWRRAAARPHTEVDVRMRVRDIGRYLARLGYPEGVRQGTGQLDGRLNWSGPPQRIDYPSLAGKLTVAADKGQFVQLQPGAGKLLSILSLQALPRRVALDFKDVFSAGFAFDEIRGVLDIDKGVATTRNFTITGSSARIAMEGTVDLAGESQRLDVRIRPNLGDSVSTVTALLGGPVAGVGVFLAQKLLDDPLGQLAAYDYRITGTWSDPQVSKVTPPVRNPAGAQP